VAEASAQAASASARASVLKACGAQAVIHRKYMRMSKAYFHIAPSGFKSGDRKPRSYGDRVRSAGALYEAEDRHAEFLREQIRATHFPKKPSRLASSFVFESLQEALDYRAAFGRELETVYEVTLLDEEALTHRVCCTMPWESMSPEQRQFDARMFWAAPPQYEGGLNEVFAETDLVILREIEPALPNSGGTT
jgi:hypothetical protein